MKKKKPSKKQLLKELFSFYQTRPSSYQMGKAITGAYGWESSALYKTALCLRDKGYIKMEEIQEVGRSGPVDISLKITTAGIEFLRQNFLVKLLKFIFKYIWQIVIGIVIGVAVTIIASN